MPDKKNALEVKNTQAVTENPTDDRVEPINVQPGNPVEAEASQEKTNYFYNADERYEFFRKLTKLNPSTKWVAQTQRQFGLPGNQSPGVNDMLAEEPKEPTEQEKETTEEERLMTSDPLSEQSRRPTRRKLNGEEIQKEDDG